MIEMLGVLAIIGVLSITVLVGFTYAMNKHRANETIYDVMLRGTNVPMIDEYYASKPSGHEFRFPGLTDGTYYAMVTKKDTGSSYYVEATGVTYRVCEMILKMNPTDIDQIVVGNTVYQGDSDICGTNDGLAMKFCFGTNGTICNGTGHGGSSGGSGGSSGGESSGGSGSSGSGSGSGSGSDPDPIPCNLSKDCSGILVCINGTCQEPPDDPTCTTDGNCTGDQVCVNGECEKPTDCESNLDCGNGLICTDGECKNPPPCTDDNDCTGDQICENGTCGDPDCTQNSDCGDLICENGRCVPPECTDDGECSNPQVCENNTCVCPEVGEPGTCQIKTIQNGCDVIVAAEDGTACITSDNENGTCQIGVCEISITCGVNTYISGDTCLACGSGAISDGTTKTCVCDTENLYVGTWIANAINPDDNGCVRDLSCMSNADCISGKEFCAFENPLSCEDTGSGECTLISTYGPDPMTAAGFVRSMYGLTWWSTQNWCLAQGKEPATRASIGCGDLDSGYLCESAAVSSFISSWGASSGWLEASQNACFAYGVTLTTGILTSHLYQPTTYYGLCK